MIYFTKIKTTIGIIYLLSDGENLISLDFKKDSRHENAKLKSNLTIFKNTEEQLSKYLCGKLKKFNLKLNLNGTSFQKEAWSTLLNIPFGTVLSYKEQSELMNRPLAHRATGSANGKNPLPIIIPCHRIITSDNRLGGYSGDIKLKEYLLKLEGHLIKNGRVITN